jgi:ABC-2 type transport system ATP-binding protein
MDTLTHPAFTGSAIACLGLTKDYGGGHGLFDLDLEVRRGEVFGFIGANGAGKTTTMRLIMDLIRPDRGSVGVLGLDAHRQSLEIKRRVGYLTGELPQYPGVKAGRVVGLLAGLRGGVDPARITGLAERLQLDLDRRFSDLSHGNKQKVGLVTAFMHGPELLVLDEPTLGLDPLMQREVRALIAEAVRDGATCMISSHVLAEIELVCDRIGLIRDGRLVRVGTLDELRSLRVHRLEAVLPAHMESSHVADLPGISDVTVDGGVFSCTVHGPITPLLAWLAENGAIELDSRELSLEEVFLAEYEPAP